MWEGGKMKTFIMDLNVAVIDKEEKDSKKKLMVEYINLSKGHNDCYAIKHLANIVYGMFNVRI